MHWHHNGKYLKNDNNFLLEFKYPIEQISSWEGDVVVVLAPPAEVIMPENVYYVNFDGSIRWQIPPNATGADPLSLYTGIIQFDHEKLIVYNSGGFALDLDKNTGEVINSLFTK